MTMLERVRSGEDGVLVVGNHPGIVQSILDFDMLCGKNAPSVLGIVAGNKKAQKFFFGTTEVLIPCFKDYASLPKAHASRVRWMLNVQSGRRARAATIGFFDAFPDALGGHLFAENIPEDHATDLIARFGSRYVLAGPSGVGLVVSGRLKLGAIGGTDPIQIAAAHLSVEGSVAVVSTSGGMTNELIRAVANAGKRVSFALSIGGDRFPVTSLSQVIALAEGDAATKAIVYFGELGGTDEYEIVEMRRLGTLTKPIICYVAGLIDEAFDERMQFGHAKALVAHADESARAKREALRAAGAIAPDSFPDFLAAIESLPIQNGTDAVADVSGLTRRTGSILSTRKIVDLSRPHEYVKDGALVVPASYGFSRAALRALLGREVSDVTAAFVEHIFELLIDHGGHVSGAVNTMITARAGKDMVASLASGLLTIGPRFGGAVNEAARTWFTGAAFEGTAAAFVELKNAAGMLIPGIGHRKYRVGIPDPRVRSLSEFTALLTAHPHYDFARAIEEVTTAKNGNLILNVDGVMAAVLLDLLVEKEGMSREEISALIDAEFFNALFIIPRSVGFIGHYMEQRRNDEGLFRLPDHLLFERPDSSQ